MTQNAGVPCGRAAKSFLLETRSSPYINPSPAANPKGWSTSERIFGGVCVYIYINIIYIYYTRISRQTVYNNNTHSVGRGRKKCWVGAKGGASELGTVEAVGWVRGRLNAIGCSVPCNWIRFGAATVRVHTHTTTTTTTTTVLCVPPLQFLASLQHYLSCRAGVDL